MTECWYVGETRPASERLAQHHLRLRGYACFCPTISELRVQRGAKVEIIKPLFPSYLFISLDLATPGWQQVYATPGVRRLLGPQNSNPEPLRADLDQLLQDIKPPVTAEEAVSRIVAGTHVRIKCGAWTGFNAIVARRKRARIQLLMSLFGRQTESDWVPVGWVEALLAEDGSLA